MPTALITGASSGIGRVLVDLCAKDGHDVILVARRDLNQVCSDTVSRYGVKATPLSVDLSKSGAAARVWDETRRLGVDVDVLINNAGFARYGVFADSDLPTQSDMIATNVTALTELTHLFLAGMVQRRRGKILQVASTAAFQPGPRMAVYYATKAFVLSFSEALSLELEGSGVTVTTLCPGPTHTEFNEVASYKTTGLAELVMMSADAVAVDGYRGMMKGERLVVTGAQNKLSAMGAQLMPRGLVLRMTAALTRSRE